MSPTDLQHVCVCHVLFVIIEGGRRVDKKLPVFDVKTTICDTCAACNVYLWHV